MSDRLQSPSRTGLILVSMLALGGLAAALGWTAAAGGGAHGGGAGAEACASCHADPSAAFAATAHGTVAGGCEACHGPGAAHADGGDRTKILNPRGIKGLAANQACLGCHESEAARHWNGSAHEMRGVRCVDCHNAHQPREQEKTLANAAVTKACLSCHPSLRKHLTQRSSHPLRDGQMSCASCHDPHGSPADQAMAAASANDKCFSCHADKRGPFLWEHAPVREDCSTCHNPHGSNQTNMLSKSAPRLCQSCHALGHHQTVPGTTRQVWNVNRSCVNCHSQIHGSNHPSGMVLLR